MTDTVSYTRLSMTEVRAALAAVAEDATRTFGRLDERQLNWRPDATRWSVAQCFEHLVKSNVLMRDAADAALTHPPTSVWQRLPLWPTLLGPMLVRAQAPSARGRKYAAPTAAQPPSEISGDVVHRFVDQHRDLVEWTRGIDERSAGRAIMISPFAGAVTYSVLDGLRLVVAHDRRHFEQARRVMESPGFASGRANHGGA